MSNSCFSNWWAVRGVSLAAPTTLVRVYDEFTPVRHRTRNSNCVGPSFPPRCVGRCSYGRPWSRIEERRAERSGQSSGGAPGYGVFCQGLVGLPRTSWAVPGLPRKFLVFVRAPSRAGGEARGSYEDRKVLGSPRKSWEVSISKQNPNKILNIS